MKDKSGLSVIYKDTLIKIAGSLLFAWFIDSIGRRESILQLLLQPSFYVNLLMGFIISFIIWEFIARFIYRLDREYDWIEKTTQRIFIQFFLGILLPSLLVFLLTFILFKALWKQDIFSSWAFTEYPMTIVLIFLINLYYIVYYFYYKWKLAEAALLKQKSATQPVNTEQNPTEVMHFQGTGPGTKSQAIIVSKGAKNIPLGADDIAYCYINADYNYIKTFDEESYLTPLSLDEIYAMLDQNMFFRANRQVIINLIIFDSYSNIENGKLQVFLKPPFKETIIISQKKAKDFKEWIIKNK